jgi:hypothetical protein
MALDGALNSLSSAFDAGVALLIQAVEAGREVDEQDRLPDHRYNWSQFRAMLTQSDIARDVVRRLIVNIDEALDGEATSQPKGWMARLRRLRNRVAHQSSLARMHEIGSSVQGLTGLLIDGERVDAFVYLANQCDRVHELTEQMIHVAISIGAHEVSTTWNRAPWYR